MKPQFPSRNFFKLSISWSVLAFFVLFSSFVLGNLPAARASSGQEKSCSLLFPLSSSNSAKSSSSAEAASEPLTSEELLRKMLPRPEDRQFFESCGQGCLQLSQQAQEKFFHFPRLHLKFMGSRQPHLALTEKVASEMRGTELKMIDPSKSSQHIYTTDKTLILPQDWMDQKLSVQQMQLFQEAWMQLVMGHPLHPYTESPFYQDKPFRWKESQIQALKAIADVRQQGKKSILLVGSGGTGKTKIITIELRRQILLEKSQDLSIRKPLHLVIANTVEHARALQEKISQEKIPGARVLRWDGQVENKDLESLYQQMQSTDQVLILVTVVNSFRQQIYQDLDHHTEQMQKYLSQIIIDEAHHAGAELLRGFLEKVMKPSSSLSTSTPFLLGLTATPVHHEIGLQNLFGQNSFFMNLDTSIQNLESERPLTEVMDQLQRTSALGEVTPLENVHVLTPEVLQIDREQLTIKNDELTDLSSEKDGKGQRRVLNPQIYPQVFSFLSPLYVSDKASLTTAGSIASAENMFAYFQKAFPGHRSQRLHSQMSSEQKKEIAEEFRQGKIQHLIVVDMMNEAFDKPDLEVLVDLSISSSPIQMIQRLARPARLYDHKEKVTAVMMMGVTDAYLDEQLQLLDRLHENQKKTRITRSHQGTVLVQNIARLPRIMVSASRSFLFRLKLEVLG